jgi:hypothetical protein
MHVAISATPGGALKSRELVGLSVTRVAATGAGVIAFRGDLDTQVH